MRSTPRSMWVSWQISPVSSQCPSPRRYRSLWVTLRGAQDYDYARQRVRSLPRLCHGSFVCHVSAALCIEWSDLFDLYGLPGDSGTGKQIMLVEIVLEFGRAVNNVMIRTYSGVGGCKIPPPFLAITCQWSVAFGLSRLFAFGFGWGLIGVWLAMAADECIRAFVLMWRWHTGAWRR